MAKKTAAKNLVIVESPAKAKTLKKFLGPSYKIEASMGHVRDLPKSELGVDIEDDFEPKYITIRGKGELLAKLRKEVKTADMVYLATDPDREGEAISWHLMHSLKLADKKAVRITFNEITKSAVKRSIKEAREIDMDLVDAQQARRSLDRIVGYKISPLLWKKVKKGLSAGRVQSVTLKMICDREEEIDNFTPQEYWSLDVQLQNGKSKKLTAKFYGTEKEKMALNNQEETDKVVKAVEKGQFIVAEVKAGTRTNKPLPPLTTSTMQQEASKLFGYSTSKVMSIAQQLYEGVDLKDEGTTGLVTYIRTDSVRISDEAYEEAKVFVTARYGEAYISPTKPEYKSRARAQDAHEAIRPTSADRTPDQVKDSLTKDQYRLYSIIWERFIASQMTPAVFDTVSATITNNGYVFRASGSVLRFEGYKAVSKREEEDKSEQTQMAEVNEGEALKTVAILPEQHFTQPPPHYSEASLVKTLEENGVGRPSTYAPTISTVIARRYVVKENKQLYPTELGEIVNDIMKNNFEDIVSVDFTAKMEEYLDQVEDGGINWKDIVRQFYLPLREQIEEAESKISEVELKDEETDIPCENCGRNMVIKYGRYGKFLACPGFPECRNTLPFFEEAGVNCPLCGGNVLVKKTKKGRKYYGCDHNPTCEFMSWNKPTGELCPECGGALVEKGSKNRKICCSNSNCHFVMEMPPDDQED